MAAGAEQVEAEKIKYETAASKKDLVLQEVKDLQDTKSKMLEEEKLLRRKITVSNCQLHSLQTERDEVQRELHSMEKKVCCVLMTLPLVYTVSSYLKGSI